MSTFPTTAVTQPNPASNGQARPRKRVLVIADRYPPSIHGGAEVSLSLTLSAMDPGRFEITVAALSDTDNRVREDVHDGITVYRIPTAPHWPATLHGAAGQRMRSRNPLTRQLGKAEAAARYVLTPRSRRTHRSRVAALTLYRALTRNGKSGWFPNMDADLVDLTPPVAAIKDIIAALQPDLIHADNYRSILIGAAAAPDATPLTAHVRDNRFFCMHRNQATHIGAAACTTCNLGCLKSAGLAQAGVIADFMEDDRRVRHAALARADRIIVTSAYLKDQIASVTFAKSIDVVPNPADDLAFVQRCQDGVEQASPPEILIVGMINHSKGQRRVPEWLPILKARLPDFRLVLAGRGQMLDRIKKDVAELGLCDHVYAPGFFSREALYRAYARASVVVAPNVWPEPFGRVPLEAGLSARPMVAYALGGPKETIVHGETGLLAPPEDQETLVEHIVRLLCAPDLAHRLGRKAFERVTERYTLDNAARLLRGSWDACLAPPGEDVTAGAAAFPPQSAVEASFS